MTNHEVGNLKCPQLKYLTNSFPTNDFFLKKNQNSHISDNYWSDEATYGWLFENPSKTEHIHPSLVIRSIAMIFW